MLTLYHNARCSTSRKAKTWLEEHGVAFQTVEYLKDFPPVEVLQQACDAVGLAALLRTKEADYKAHFEGKNLSEAQQLALLETYPKVLQRPLLTDGTHWAIGRPIENFKKVLLSL